MDLTADEEDSSAAAVAANAGASSSGSGAHVESGPGSFSPFIVVNESGSPLQVWSPSATGALLGRSSALSASGGCGGASSASLPLLVHPGTQAPLSAAFLGLRSGDDGGAAAAAFAQRYLLGRPAGGAGGAEEEEEEGGAAAPDGSCGGRALDWECDSPDDAGRVSSAPSAPAAATASLDDEADAASADVISPAVSVLLSLQLEGFQPLRQVVVSRTGITRVPLHLLRANQAKDRGVALLRAPAPLAATIAAATTTDTALGRWDAALRVASESPAALPYAHVELLVEDGPGGCKVVRVRSLVTVRSSYMMGGEEGISCHLKELASFVALFSVSSRRSRTRAVSLSLCGSFRTEQLPLSLQLRSPLTARWRCRRSGCLHHSVAGVPMPPGTPVPCTITPGPPAASTVPLSTPQLPSSCATCASPQLLLLLLLLLHRSLQPG